MKYFSAVLKQISPSLIFLIYFTILVVKAFIRGMKDEIPLYLAVGLIIGAFYVYYVMVKKMKNDIRMRVN
jgi:hypothetical protein